jgi:hypothetical protein
MTVPVRVLLVDDHTVFRESLLRLLAREPDLEVVGHCATVAKAGRSLPERRSISSCSIMILAKNPGRIYSNTSTREEAVFESSCSPRASWQAPP